MTEPFLALQAIVASDDPAFRHLLRVVLGALDFGGIETGRLDPIVLHPRPLDCGEILFIDVDSHPARAEALARATRQACGPGLKICLVAADIVAPLIALRSWGIADALMRKPISIPGIGDVVAECGVLAPFLSTSREP